MTRQCSFSLRFGISLGLLLSLPSCGNGTAPKIDATGTWTTEKVGHGDYTLLTLSQDGKQVLGFACQYSTSAPLYEGAVVTGDIGEFGYTVKPENVAPFWASLAGTTFNGRFVDATLIAGERTYSAISPPQPARISFTREPRPDINVCPPKR